MQIKTPPRINVSFFGAVGEAAAFSFMLVRGSHSAVGHFGNSSSASRVAPPPDHDERKCEGEVPVRKWTKMKENNKKSKKLKEIKENVRKLKKIKENQQKIKKSNKNVRKWKKM